MTTKTPPARASSTVEDRLDILELSSKYAWGIDTVDRNLLATVFAQDAVADYEAVGDDNPLNLHEHLVGFEAIYGWMQQNLGHRKGTQALPGHYVTNQVVDLHGDSADLRYYMHNRSMALGGVYYVRAARTSDGWRIKHLRLEEQTWNTDYYRNNPTSLPNLSKYLGGKP